MSVLYCKLLYILCISLNVQALLQARRQDYLSEGAGNQLVMMNVDTYQRTL